MLIRADRDKCIGSGACVLTAPGVFDQDEDGVVVALAESPPTELEAAARDAVLACPAAAIWSEDP